MKQAVTRISSAFLPHIHINRQVFQFSRKILTHLTGEGTQNELTVNACKQDSGNQMKGGSSSDFVCLSTDFLLFYSLVWFPPLEQDQKQLLAVEFCQENHNLLLLNLLDFLLFGMAEFA